MTKKPSRYDLYVEYCKTVGVTPMERENWEAWSMQPAQMGRELRTPSCEDCWGKMR